MRLFVLNLSERSRYKDPRILNLLIAVVSLRTIKNTHIPIIPLLYIINFRIRKINRFSVQICIDLVGALYMYGPAIGASKTIAEN